MITSCPSIDHLISLGSIVVNVIAIVLAYRVATQIKGKQDKNALFYNYIKSDIIDRNRNK